MITDICKLFRKPVGVILSLVVLGLGVPVDVGAAPKKVSVLGEQDYKEVKGTVTDQYGPVIGATVTVQGSKVGTTTDLDGNYSLKVPTGATIVFSYMGYEDRVIQYAGESVLNVEIAESSIVLDEVQVVAYGSARKVTVTGSMASVNTEEILKSPVSSMSNALTGKVTGVTTVQSTGQPGADDPTIYVRGVGSLNDSSPLILVDGVERSFNQIDPNEVEDITVLKDASATAVFGVRGANGVILVTTKRGTEGRVKISYSSSIALQAPTRMPEFANSYEYATTYVKAQEHDGVSPDQYAFTPEMIEAFRTKSNTLAYPDTDWTSMLIKKVAPQSQHNISISGGTKSVRFFASVGLFTQDGLFRSFEEDYDGNFSYTRLNYRVNLDINLTKTTLMSINLGGRVNDRHAPNYESSNDITYLFRDIYWATPFSGVGIVDGKWLVSDSDRFSGLPGELRDALYPYYGRGYNQRQGNTLNFDFKIEQKLDFITKGLKFHAKGSYNSGLSYTKTFKGNEPRYEVVLTEEGETHYKKVGDKTALSFSDGTSEARDWYLEAAFNYARTFGKHNVTALAMYNQSMKYYQGGGFNSIPRSYIGFVGRITYNYAMKYMIDANIGYNGSENFAKGKRFGLFPAMSAGWIITEEPFMKWIKPAVSYMKLRASYGVVGNDKSSYRFLYLSDSYSASSGSNVFGTGLGTSYAGADELKKGNQDVTWEKAYKQNYGLDVNFLDQKLKLEVDVFREDRKDILTSRSVLPGYLEVSLPVENIGKMRNQGVESSLTWRSRVRKFNYHVGFNVSYAKNTVIYKDEIEYPYDWMRATGKPYGQKFGYKFDRFFTEQDCADYAINAGKEGGIPDHGSGFVPKPGDVMYKDLNGDGLISDYDKSAIGYPDYPLLNGAINLGFSIAGFDLSMTIAGATLTSRYVGGIFRKPFGDTNSRSLMKYMVTDAWSPETAETATAPAISFTNKSNNYLDSDLWLKDASYLRLKNVEFGYSLPKNTLNQAHISSLRVYVSGYNLLTLDKLKILDPESKTNDSSMYPLVMVINTGFKIGF